MDSYPKLEEKALNDKWYEKILHDSNMLALRSQDLREKVQVKIDDPATPSDELGELHAFIVEFDSRVIKKQRDDKP